MKKLIITLTVVSTLTACFQISESSSPDLTNEAAHAQSQVGSYQENAREKKLKLLQLLMIAMILTVFIRELRMLLFHHLNSNVNYYQVKH